MHKKKHTEIHLGTEDYFILKIEHLFLQVAGEAGSRRKI